MFGILTFLILFLLNFVLTNLRLGFGECPEHHRLVLVSLPFSGHLRGSCAFISVSVTP